MSSFHPPQRILMGPGPSDVPPRVLEALARPTIGHLDPLFVDLMDNIKTLLRYSFRTRNLLTLPISAPGSAGMECCFANLVEPGDTVVVCQNGVFGGRMKENVERAGGKAIMVSSPWGSAIDTEKVEQALATHPQATALAFVHAETSTGALSDAATLCQLAKKYHCLSIVDAVTSLAGVPVMTDEWGIDAVYSGSQKCLSCVPGLSPVSFSQTAIDKVQNRKAKVHSWFLDLQLMLGYWQGKGKRSYHHTAPVNTLYALHESLLMLKEETLEKAWQRHQYHHQALVTGLEAMGLELLVKPQQRLPQLNSVAVPQGVDEALVRSLLLERYQLEIGAGLGELAGKVWRIGLMGHTANQQNVLTLLGSMEATLTQLQAPVHKGDAVQAALRFYDRQN